MLSRYNPLQTIKIANSLRLVNLQIIRKPLNRFPTLLYLLSVKSLVEIYLSSLLLISFFRSTRHVCCTLRGVRDAGWWAAASVSGRGGGEEDSESAAEAGSTTEAGPDAAAGRDRNGSRDPQRTTTSGKQCGARCQQAPLQSAASAQRLLLIYATKYRTCSHWYASCRYTAFQITIL